MSHFGGGVPSDVRFDHDLHAFFNEALDAAICLNPDSTIDMIALAERLLDVMTAIVDPSTRFCAPRVRKIVREKPPAKKPRQGRAFSP